MIPAPAAIFQTWLDQHPRYSYIARCYEVPANGAPVTSTLRISFDAPTHTATVHVISGKSAGTDARWDGGSTIQVQPAGMLHALTLRLDLRNAQVLSPRGNDIRAADLTRIAACFATDAEHDRTETAGDQLTLIDDAPHCTEGYGPAPVTSDRLTLDAADGHPIERERLDGTSVVERWTISDLQAPPAAHP
jgi:hypothetical protein